MTVVHLYRCMNKRLLGELVVSGVSAPESAVRLVGAFLCTASMAGGGQGVQDSERLIFALPCRLLRIIPAD